MNIDILNELFLDLDSTLQEAIEVINRNSGFQICMVADKNKRLLGTITDGDARRAILNGHPLSIPVDLVMNKSPSTLKQDASKSEILNVLQTKKILQIPIVDKLERVISIETFHTLNEQNKLNNPVLLMAGGLGKRLHPLTLNCPKPMLPIGKQPLLEKIIQDCMSYGLKNYYISVCYMKEFIIDYFKNGSLHNIKIEYLIENSPAGTGGCLTLLKEKLDSDQPVLCINSDLLTAVNYKQLLDYHSQNNADITMCVREYEYQFPYGVVEHEGVLVKKITEKPTFSNFINAGIYVISADLIKGLIMGSPFDMTHFIEDSIKHGKKAILFPIHEYWSDIGKIEQYEKVKFGVEA